MYIHIGANIVVPYQDIIAILNLQNSDLPDSTKEFLELAHSGKKIKGCSQHLAKSCIITKETVYYSIISTDTLLKRTSMD